MNTSDIDRLYFDKFTVIGWYSKHGVHMNLDEHGNYWVYADECEECSGYDED